MNQIIKYDRGVYAWPEIVFAILKDHQTRRPRSIVLLRDVQPIVANCSRIDFFALPAMLRDFSARYAILRFRVRAQRVRFISRHTGYDDGMILWRHGWINQEQLILWFKSMFCNLISRSEASHFVLCRQPLVLSPGNFFLRLFLFWLTGINRSRNQTRFFELARQNLHLSIIQSHVELLERHISI